MNQPVVEFDDAGPFSSPYPRYGQYDPCASNVDCGCPFSCQSDPALSETSLAPVCLIPCSISNDCDLTTSFCQGGVCKSKRCAFANGFTGAQGDAGFFWAPCDADGTKDGICFPTGIGIGDVLGVCQLTGTLGLGATCTPRTTRDAGPGALCAQGTECLSDQTSAIQASVPFSCQSVCSIANQDPNQCPSGKTCVISALLGYEDGEIGFPGGEAEYNLCSAIGQNGCIEATPAFLKIDRACNTGADCACAQTCTFDPLLDSSICAAPCTTTADCTNMTTSCQNGTCLRTPCAADGGATCVLPGGGGTGTCVPVADAAVDGGNGNLFNPPGAACIQSGTSRAACDATGSSNNPANLCTPGLVCQFTASGGTCQAQCSLIASAMGTPSGCTARQTCTPVEITAALGLPNFQAADCQ